MGLIKTAIMTGGGIYAVHKLAKVAERPHSSSSYPNQNQNQNQNQGGNGGNNNVLLLNPNNVQNTSDGLADAEPGQAASDTYVLFTLYFSSSLT